ncbi:MAG: DUF4145 domain-containing protein [Pseudomonadales bacterium]
MTFNVNVGARHIDRNYSTALAFCSACNQPVAAKFYLSTGHFSSGNDLADFNGDLLKNENLYIMDFWPKAEVIASPASVPDRVARNYIEAVQARKARLWNAACGSYRRCMELALKEFAPDIDAWKLEKRIDKLASENRITPDIQEWAHSLRLDGNEALHGDADATEEMAEQMHHLTYFLLTYLYTLPNQIQQTRNRREQNGADLT